MNQYMWDAVMYVQVMLINGFEKHLLYHVPPELESTVCLGAVVVVPVQRRRESGVVVEVLSDCPASVDFAIKDVYACEKFPHDELFYQFARRIASFYCLRPLHVYQRVRHFLKERHSKVEAALDAHDQQASSVTLTDEQQAIVDYVAPFIDQPAYVPTLIHGVTGSGKTEVYKKLIQHAIDMGKTVLLLLPEVSLAVQFEHLLRRHLPAVSIYGFHSASKETEKRVVWEKLVQGEPLLILGVHLPVLLPCSRLGLIIVDEEHEQGFCEKRHPKLNSKELALWRASHYRIPIILGSATPSLNSLYNVERHGWKKFSITKRFAGTFPAITKVILTQQARGRRAFWISRELEQAVKDCLERKEQVIIFLNRRGYSFFVQCKVCGFIFRCSQCSVSLTLHRAKDDVSSDGQLRCHYCDYRGSIPAVCPECKAPAQSFLKKGIGTQQVVQLFQEIFPTARIRRADLDSTKQQREWQQTVELFGEGKIDIFIGTQTITKGYHFPRVTLVGVLWADQNLHFPVFNARETTLQQLIQVAGRAGRQCAGGRVILQTMHDHPIFDFIDEVKYCDFCADELAMRREASYPPCARLACIEVKHTDVEQVDADALCVATKLREINQKLNLNVMILGPTSPAISRVQNYEMRHIFIKSTSFQPLHALVAHLGDERLASGVFAVLSQ
jgi:primosomal protein N' (replication factor Y) (superfamily II helicase)